MTLKMWCWIVEYYLFFTKKKKTNCKMWVLDYGVLVYLFFTKKKL